MANIQKINLIKPICYLHETEKYFPMKLNDYLDNCYVKKKNNDLVKFKYDITGKYKEDVALYPNKNEKFANVKSLYRGNPNVDKVPYIVKVNDLGNGKSQIIFFFFFGYNGETRILKDLIKLGKHYADLEHIYMIVDNNILNNSNNKSEAIKSIDSVFYAAHSGGETFKLKDLEKEDDSIVVYIASRSHASYRKKGLYLRYFGFGNDYTKKYYKWYPELYIIDKNFDPQLNDFINNYRGQLGFDHIWSFATRDYFYGKLEKNKPEGVYLNENIYKFLIYSLFIINLLLFGREFYVFRKNKVINKKIIITLVITFILLVIFYALNTTYID